MAPGKSGHEGPPGGAGLAEERLLIDELTEEAFNAICEIAGTLPSDLFMAVVQSYVSLLEASGSDVQRAIELLHEEWKTPDGTTG